jgi:hypothetical protein
MLRRLVPFTIALGGMLAGLAAEEPRAFELSLNGFAVPDVAQAEYLGYIRWDYTEKVAGAESLVRLYRTAEGMEFRSVSTNGRIWLYSIQDGSAPQSRFHLADANGDGLFEARFMGAEKVPVPYWVLSSDGSDEDEAGR